MKQVPYSETQNISRHRKIFCRHGDLLAEICAPLLYKISTAQMFGDGTTCTITST